MSKTIKQPVNVDFCGGELQNFKFQNLTTTPASPAAGMTYYDSVNNVPKYYNGTSWSEFGRVYSASTGITIGSDNAISVTDYASLLKNSTSESTSVGILPSTLVGGTYCTSIGYNAKTASNNFGETVNHSTAIGSHASVVSNYGTSIGGTAGVSADYAIQLGYGSNSTASSFSVGFYNGSDINAKNWQLLDGTTGLIPDARISSNIVKTSIVGVANGVASLGADGKVPSSQLPAYVDDVVELLTMGSAPSTCATGDKYFNTTSNKIFTATATNTWGTTGEDPIKDIIYVRTDTNGSYRWSGSSMINIANPIGAATESAAGIAEIATTSEVSTGTDDERIVTPLKLSTYLSNNYQGKLTQSTGITLNNNTISVTDYSNLLKNISTATNSLTLLGTANTSYQKSINIGFDTQVKNGNATAIGYGAVANLTSVAIGNLANADSASGGCIAIGSNANATAQEAMQIGYGTNSSAKTLYVGFSSVSGTPNYKLLDGTTGLIPDDRLNPNIVKKRCVNNPSLTASGGGVTWSITNGLGTKDVQVAVYEVSTGEQIFPAVKVATTSPYGITVEMLASANVAADTYRAVVMG